MNAWISTGNEIYTPGKLQQFEDTSIEPLVQFYRLGRYFSVQAIALYIACESHAHNLVFPPHQLLRIHPVWRKHFEQKQDKNWTWAHMSKAMMNKGKEVIRNQRMQKLKTANQSFTSPDKCCTSFPESWVNVMAVLWWLRDRFSWHSCWSHPLSIQYSHNQFYHLTRAVAVFTKETGKI